MKKLVTLLFLIPLFTFGQHHMMHVLSNELVGNPVYQSVSTLIGYSATSSVDVTIPESVADGDLGILQVQQGANSTTLTLPAGWNLITSFSATGQSAVFAWKRLMATESSTTVTTTSSVAGNLYGIITTFRGAITLQTPYNGSVGIYTPSIGAFSAPTTYSHGTYVFLFVLEEDNLSITGETAYTNAYRKYTADGTDAGFGGYYCTKARTVQTPSDDFISPASAYMCGINMVFK